MIMKTIWKSNTSLKDLPPSLITVNLKNLNSWTDHITWVQTSVGEIIGDLDWVYPSFSESKKWSPDDILISAGSLFMNNYMKNAYEKWQTPITISLNTDRTNLHPNTKVTETIEAKTTN